MSGAVLVVESDGRRRCHLIAEPLRRIAYTRPATDLIFWPDQVR